MLLGSKFQGRTSNKHNEHNDLSERAETSFKQFEIAGERTYRLQKTCSYKRQSKNYGIDYLETDLKFKGVFISPQTVYMNINEIK
jgi:hypothetical protein